jgi:hypothetical protein
VLPSGFELRRESFCKGWVAAAEVSVSELDASIRSLGWHFMWITDGHSSRGLGTTSEMASRRAVIRALKAIKMRFNAAELDSLQIASCLGFQAAKVTLHARHIQKHTSLDSPEELRLQQVLAL